jgi:hypothetical protein
MADALAALSIIFGMITALYIQWSGEIQKALDLPKQEYREDGTIAHETVKSTIKKYASPLLVTSTLLSVVIAPEWYKIVRTTIDTIYTYKLGAFDVKYYNIVNAIFMFIGFLSFGLTVYTSTSFLRLLKKKKQLKP